MMEMKLKKIRPLIGAFCLSMATSAFAQSNYQSGTYGSDTSQPVQGNYQRGTFREITPAAGPRVAHGADIVLNADFIWWKVSQDGLEYAFTGIPNQDNLPTTADALGIGAQAPKGRNATVGEDWAPGFKIGLGLNLGHDGWDLLAQYTWLHANDKDSISTKASNQVMMSTFGAGTENAFVLGERASSKWDLHFNAIDLELGRNFYVSPFLTMRPFIGLKGTWQSQDWKSYLHGTDFTVRANDPANNNRLAVTGPYHTHQILNTWGIGARGGLNVTWYVTKSWSVYGDFSVSSMMTSYCKSKRKDTLDDLSTGTKRSQLLVNIDNDNFYNVKYVGEAELGLRWENWFYDDNYHFAIQAGWEEQVWVDYLRLTNLVDQSSQDLSFHGLNLKFRFDF